MRIHDITLMRHGEIEGIVKRVYYGATNYPLSENGRAQASAAGKRLSGQKFDRVYTSTLDRARQTLLLATGGGGLCLPQATADARLNEMNFGEFEGCGYDDISAKFPEDALSIANDWMNHRFRGGESPTEFLGRVKSFFDDLEGAEGSTLIVCHGGTVRAAICALLETDQFWRYKCDYCSTTRIQVNDGYAVLSSLNHV